MSPYLKLAIQGAAALPVLAICLLVGWNWLGGFLSDRYDRAVARDPDSGIVVGALPRRLGPEDTPGAVLLVHGFIGTPNHFADLPEQIAAQGWRVEVLLLPGHGRSPREFDTLAPETLVTAVEEALRRLHDRYGPVVIIGHSMGGALSTIAAAETGLADGVILAAPYFGLTHRWWYGLTPETWLAWGAPLLRWIYVSPDHQPVQRAGVSREIISYRWFTTRCAQTAGRIADKANSPDILSRIQSPVLVLHGRADSVTDPKKSRAALEAMATPDKNYRLLEHSDHMVFWDNDREEVTAEVLNFLARLQRKRLSS